MQPILMDFKDLNVCIVGFGPVGRHKAAVLLEQGAVVTIVDPVLLEECMKDYPSCRFIQRAYTEAVLEHMDCVVASTSDRALNLQIALDAKTRHVMCSVSDNGDAGTFTFMSVVRRGKMSLGISTQHTFPGLAKKIRGILEDYFPEDYGDYIDYMAQQRAVIKTLSSAEKEAALKTLLKTSYDLYKQGREKSES